MTENTIIALIAGIPAILASITALIVSIKSNDKSAKANRTADLAYEKAKEVEFDAHDAWKVAMVAKDLARTAIKDAQVASEL